MTRAAPATSAAPRPPGAGRSRAWTWRWRGAARTRSSGAQSPPACVEGGRCKWEWDERTGQGIAERGGVCADLSSWRAISFCA
eukprot:286125-Chlamydomonas_euryale.AAC.1